MKTTLYVPERLSVIDPRVDPKIPLPETFGAGAATAAVASRSAIADEYFILNMLRMKECMGIKKFVQ
jgi:hypothetical protein